MLLRGIFHRIEQARDVSVFLAYPRDRLHAQARWWRWRASPASLTLTLRRHAGSETCWIWSIAEHLADERDCKTVIANNHHDRWKSVHVHLLGDPCEDLGVIPTRIA